jgi:integral membrane sensor domain MASE1/GAF domain-containing protein
VITWGSPVVFAVVLVAYALLARSAYDLFGALDIGVTFFPPAGLTFAAFMILPHRRWPAVALAIVVAEIAVDMERGNGFLWSAAWAAANLAEPLVGALVARRYTPRIDLGRRSVAAVVAGGLVIGPVVGASIGATTLAIADDFAWWSAFSDVWVGDALGVLVVAPAVMLFLQPPAAGWRALARLTWRNADPWLLLALLVAMSIVLPNVDDIAVGYAVIPVLAWPAIRMSPRALAVAAVTLASVTTAATARGRGPWAGATDADTQAQLGRQQFFLLVAIGGAWLLALEVRERTRAVALAQSVASDAALLSRALHAGRMGAWTWDGITGEVRWDPQLEQLYGLEPGAFDGSPATWLALVHPDDREAVTAGLAGSGQPGHVWRVAHRCLWPDGSVHWIEGMGEVAVDAAGAVVGAFGVAADIDDRRRADDERARLLEIERAGRQRADLHTRVHSAVGYSLELAELVERITAAAVPAFGEWCSLVLTLDQPEAEPLLATVHTDPAQAAAAQRYQIERHRSPGGPAHVAEVRRTGRTLFIPVIDDDMIAAIDDDSQRALVERLDLRSTIIVALPSQLGVLGVLELVRTSSSPPYTAADVELAEDLARTVGAALNSALLYRRQLRARRALDTLQALTGRLAVALTREEIVRTVVDHGASSLAADGAMLYLLAADGTLELAAHTGLAEDRVGRWAALGPASHGPLADAVRRRTTVVLRGRSEILERYPDMVDPPDDETSLVALPLVIRNASFGGLVFTFDRRRDFADEDLAMLETLAGRCAGALERARLYDEQRDASLTLQRRLLPGLPPLPSWIEAGAIYRPTTGGEVGGDWYQVLVVDDDRCVAALGDAVGRGIGAAAAMGQLRAVVTGAAHVDPDPAVVLAATDEFAAAGADTRCTSLAYTLIDRRGDRLHYACAGHPPPVLVRADGDAELLADGRSSLLGTGATGSTFAVAELTFAPGDTLVLYSDGLVERRGEGIDEGIERLRATASRLRHESPSVIGAELVQALIGDAEVTDDVAVLVLRRL